MTGTVSKEKPITTGITRKAKGQKKRSKDRENFDAVGRSTKCGPGGKGVKFYEQKPS